MPRAYKLFEEESQERGHILTTDKHVLIAADNFTYVGEPKNHTLYRFSEDHPFGEHTSEFIPPGTKVLIRNNRGSWATIGRGENHIYTVETARDFTFAALEYYKGRFKKKKHEYDEHARPYKELHDEILESIEEEKKQKIRDAENESRRKKEKTRKEYREKAGPQPTLLSILERYFEEEEKPF